jgi:hypothetical protein
MTWHSNIQSLPAAHMRGHFGMDAGNSGNPGIALG